MQSQGIVYFGATMFLALVALAKWKRRRETVAARLIRGLRGYVAAESTVVQPKTVETPKENPIRVP